jgi:hypothetical protein
MSSGADMYSMLTSFEALLAVMLLVANAWLAYLLTRARGQFQT